jgi:CRISPR-associated endonuclease/helicase Cas3
MPPEFSPREQLSAVSEPARLVWAKHQWRSDESEADSWLPLWCHMADSAEAAALLWDHWLPRRLREQIAAPLPHGADAARALLCWLAAVHDIGKCTPAFSCQVDDLAQVMATQGGLTAPTQKAMVDRRLAPHGLAGQVLLRDWLAERHGWDIRRTYQLTVIIGGHHGVQPDEKQEKELLAHPELLRTPGSAEQWRSVQGELLTACAQATGAEPRLDDWRTVSLPQPVQVLLSALVITADWIASNTDYFPLVPGADLRSPDRGANAWRTLGLPGPWRS